ncbi:hypothetical protein WDW37_08195 [Bdellovibrionota bacterium FG-1]
MILLSFMDDEFLPISALPDETKDKLMDLDQLWNLAEPQVAEASYRGLLAAAESLSGPDRGYLVDLYTQIARAEAAQGKALEAHFSLEKAQHLLEEQETDYRVSVKIRWLLETGRLNVLERTPSQARPHFVQAWTLAINSGEDYLAVDLALMMAAIEPQKVQQEWIMRAIQLVENSSQNRVKRWLGSVYSALGWKQFGLRQYEAALAVFQKALGHLKIHGSKREVFVAQWSIGKVLRVMGRLDEALVIQHTLLSEQGLGGTRDGRLFEELAECLQTLKRSDEAQPYFGLAYQELSIDPWVVDNQPVALKRLKELGKVK